MAFCFNRRRQQAPTNDAAMYVQIPSGTLVAERSIDPQFPGIEVYLVPQDADLSKDENYIAIVHIEDVTMPVIYGGEDCSMECSVPESRMGSDELWDGTELSTIEPGLICRVLPNIYGPRTQKVIAFDHAKREEDELNGPF